MIPFGEVRDSLWGAWRLAHMDPGGLRWFNLTAEGFYRSFVAVLLVAPAFLFLVWLNSTVGVSPRPILADLLAYPVLWLIYPALLALVGRGLGFAHSYATGVIAYNWAQVVITGVMLPISVLALSDAAGLFGAFLYLLTYAASLVYTWFALRTALETSGAVAAALTAAGELVGILIQRTFAAMF